MHRFQGFTLIELLVVLAIIAVIASIVIPRLDSARERSVEAKISSELSSFHGLGMSEEIVAGTYNVVCGMNNIPMSPKLVPLVDSLQANSNLFVCNSTDDAFAASAQVNTTEHWCVDSAGFKGPVPGALGGGVTQCP